MTDWVPFENDDDQGAWPVSHPQPTGPALLARLVTEMGTDLTEIADWLSLADTGTEWDLLVAAGALTDVKKRLRILRSQHTTGLFAS